MRAAPWSFVPRNQGGLWCSDSRQIGQGRAAGPAGPGAEAAAHQYFQFRYDAVADGPPAAPDTACYAGAGCTRAQLAAFDTYEVRKTLHADYPGARIVVCRDGKVWDAGAGALTWECAGDSAAPFVIKLGWLERGKEHEPVVPAIAVVVAGAFS